GAIEQDADIVIFPYRPQYYNIQSRADGTSTHQLMEVDFAKNRSGSVETVDLRYLGKYGRVTDWIDVHVMNEAVPSDNQWTQSFPESVSSEFDDEEPF